MQFVALGPATTEELAALPQVAGAALPPDYLDWLGTVGGADLSSWVDMPPAIGTGCFNHVYTAIEAIRTQQNRARDDRNYGPEFLGIASSGNGGSACLLLTGPDAGSIWWCDDTIADAQGPAAPGVLTPIAATWTEFWQRTLATEELDG
ncbi:SMI1/KNR4 family protein [Enemella evansiae]|uniref:SMI1/KNR4 family protein n=1 Tax=Enemella evansiae TaxID=2016499 RepID=UPI0010EF67D6|nr:SMI1/KNR4 family protein [Enemella evansiae]TDO87628.1 SMI1/KNR4 family protein SUKH-1 [Enemella evansiae]